MSSLLDLDSVVIWTLALVIALAIVLPYTVSFWRRRRADRSRLAEAQALGIDRPTAQYPFIDAASCIGCGACVRACPEGDVLGVVGGIAVVINGLRCVGHGRCADACPVGAIEIGLGDLKGRRDVPILTDEHESTIPGVFIAGELGGLALIRNAVEQGSAVAQVVADRLKAAPSRSADVSDLLIVGAGPAGIATALAAREAGLRVEIVDQSASLGGTLLHFPRRKMVLTRPVAFPGGASLGREEYSKEELLEVLQTQVTHRRLEIAFGERLEAIEPGDGWMQIRTSKGTRRSRYVVLALGRRGTPRKLGVPGEERSKVMYQLRDAESYRGQRILVVGGGDSAIEAAVGLVRQPGTKVTLSYRKNAFYRIKRKNQSAIEVLMERNRVRVLFESEVTAIEADRVILRVGPRSESIDNDYVFVFAGGEPPFELLRKVGVRFGGDEATAAPSPRQHGVVIAGLAALVLGFGALTSAVAQESPHGEKQIACTDCHDSDRWLPVKKNLTFEHESTGFPLAGRHAKLNCTQCHTAMVFTRTPTACVDCHRDIHLGALGLACERCHDPGSWDNRNEFGKKGHQSSLFPLLAGHARVDCEACHAGQRADQYVFTPRECIACHKADYLAAGSSAHVGPPTDCVRCHSPFPNTWAPTDFQHPARFPLTGEHARLACSECHRGPAGTTSPDCYSCHRKDYEGTRDPNHVAGGFSQQCANCHTTTSWSSGTFDHATTGFLLDGAHRSVACSSCHLNGYAGTPRDCYSCHKADFTGTSDPNHVASGFPTTCQSCHSTTSWAGATFNHAATGFPLQGAHVSVACSTCHKSGYAGTPTACYACHKADYDATTDPDHVASAFPTTCQSCHSQSAWAGATFDHAITGYVLQGAHRNLACSACHANGYAGTPTDCYSCHKSDYQNAENHVSQNYSKQCQNCHNQNTFGD